MTVNHDVVGSSPTGGVCKRSKERFFIYLSGVILIPFLFSSLLIFNIFYSHLVFKKHSKHSKIFGTSLNKSVTFFFKTAQACSMGFKSGE